MFMPKPGDVLTVKLPSEMIRATVTDARKPDVVTAVLDQAHPFSRLHGFEFGDEVKCRRTNGVFGEEWEALSKPPARSVAPAKPVAHFAPPDVRAAPEAPLPKRKGPSRRSEAEKEKKRG